MELSLSGLSNELSSLISRISPSVVAVHGRRRFPSSGVVWRKDLIVTAEHTLRRDEDITVTSAEGGPLAAVFAGRDPGTDLALLRVDGLATPPIGSWSADLRPGDLTAVIGRSPESGANASMGILSAVSGPWRTWRGGQLDRYIRLDATLFPSSNGGAVIDDRGRVIGIASGVLSRIAGLAIPATTVNRVVDILAEKGSVPQGYLGVGLQTVAMPETFQKKFSIKRSQGMMVLSVEPGGPAEKSGILVGDILLDIEGKAVETIEGLQALLHGNAVGKELRARVIRGGEIRELGVRVGERNPKKAE